MSAATPAEAPPEVREVFVGLGLLAASANVVMQLSWRPVGRGVALSRVDSGRADLHPIKRARTTLGYLAIVAYGSPEERRALRREVNRQHRQVHSRPGEDVAYDAMDPELQLWVAACLHKGGEDIYRYLHPDPDPAALDRLYDYDRLLATTLQVPEHMWPPDREAFRRYWEAGVERVEMDDITRAYLHKVASQSLLFEPLGRWGRLPARLIAPFGYLITGGFLPERFREELRMPWSDRDQARFDRLMSAVIAVHRRTPRPVAEFPYNWMLWDARRRLGAGRAFV